MLLATLIFVTQMLLRRSSHFLEHKTPPLEVLSLVLLVGAVLSVCLYAYLDATRCWIVSRREQNINDQKSYRDRIIGGREEDLTEDARRSKLETGIAISEMLRENEFSTEGIWPPSIIAWSRIQLLTAWFLAVVLGAIGWGALLTVVGEASSHSPILSSVDEFVHQMGNNEWKKEDTNLQGALSSLYATNSEIARIAEQAGMNRGLLNLDGNALTAWHNVINQAKLQGKRDALIQVALSEFPDSNLLKDATESR